MTIVTYAPPKATTGPATVAASSQKLRTEREIDPKGGAKVDAFFARMVGPPGDD